MLKEMETSWEVVKRKVWDKLGWRRKRVRSCVDLRWLVTAVMF